MVCAIQPRTVNAMWLVCLSAPEIMSVFDSDDVISVLNNDEVELEVDEVVELEVDEVVGLGFIVPNI